MSKMKFYFIILTISVSSGIIKQTIKRFRKKKNNTAVSKINAKAFLMISFVSAENEENSETAGKFKMQSVRREMGSRRSDD